MLERKDTFDGIAEIILMMADGHLPDAIERATGADQSIQKRRRLEALRRQVPPAAKTNEYILWGQRFAKATVNSHAYGDPMPYLYEMSLAHRENLEAVVVFHRAWVALGHGDRDAGLPSRKRAPKTQAERRYLDACDVLIRSRNESENLAKRASAPPRESRTQMRLRIMSGELARADEAKQREKQHRKKQVEQRVQERELRLAKEDTERRKVRREQAEIASKNRREAADKKQRIRDGRPGELFGRWLSREHRLLMGRHSALFKVESKHREEPEADHVRIARRLRLKHRVAKELLDVARRLPAARQSIADGMPIRVVAQEHRIEIAIAKLLLITHLWDHRSPPLDRTSLPEDEAAAIREMRSRGYSIFDCCINLRISEGRCRRQLAEGGE
ncbi:hypothetical protein [Roseiconus lacunae]|uniref:hypothetical protein n=1 Tax=Roseiconus lacunae TaxID=2605694 RepID=UPI001E46E4B7|nr:hypothetical protein [Roseiconus lacunae]MCD0459938.1 hypothetical protein [Roseiconus lacunae]